MCVWFGGEKRNKSEKRGVEEKTGSNGGEALFM
jgi:hypothetical protein